MKPNLKRFFLFAVVIVAFSFVFIQEYQRRNSVAFKLAIISEHDRSPSRSAVSSFDEMLDYFEEKYMRFTKQEIAEALLLYYEAAMREFQYSASLLEFTRDFKVYILGAGAKYNQGIRSAIAGFVITTIAKNKDLPAAKKI